MSCTSGSGAYIVDDLQKAVITPAGELRRTTPRCFKLLAFLHAHPGKLFSNESLLRHIWTEYAEPENVRLAVLKTRRDIGPDCIDAVYGYGYGVGIKSEGPIEIPETYPGKTLQTWSMQGEKLG